ncbi:MAG: LysM peptidoglycan-binding domain-containing protein [Gammaproteobacteria bacterium]
MYLRSFVFAALLVMTTGFAAADSHSVELNPSHPDKYVVEKGDTLWDISKMFLKDPWYWPEIWYVNPQIENPHLIYPGDLLQLVYIDGKPQLQLTRGSENRLSPSVREEPIDGAITSIPFNEIRPFLAGGQIMDKRDINKMAYIMGMRGRVVAGAGHEVFVTDLDEDIPVGTQLLVMSPDEKLRDPEDDSLLGIEMEYVATAELRKQGDPATIFLTKSKKEASIGDKVGLMAIDLPMNYFPSAPADEIKGQIVAVLDGVSMIGQYQMVIINRGTDDGLSEGNILQVWKRGEEVNDPSRFMGKTRLPEKRAGDLMVIKAFEEISYALVMEAEVEMKVKDYFTNP